MTLKRLPPPPIPFTGGGGRFQNDRERGNVQRWFRHYAGLTRDDKLLSAALAAGQTPERAVWLFCAILEDAAERNDGGAFQIDLRGAAWALGCKVADLTAIMEQFARLGRIAGGRVVAWPKRQFESDNSTARVRRHRGARNGAAAML